MAKGTNKPASKPKAKKAEPAPKKEAAKEKEVVEETIPVEKVEEKPKPKKAKAKKKEKVEKVVEEKSATAMSKAGRFAFPSAEDCKHPTTKRTIDRRLRAMHVCTNPQCKKIVRFGAR